MFLGICILFSYIRTPEKNQWYGNATKKPLLVHIRLAAALYGQVSEK
jgi:hypothetical protein